MNNNINIQMYTQMGYTQSQVYKAYQYSKKNKIDIFDALQQLQNKQYVQKQKITQANIPTFSYLNNIKNINLNQYQIIYSKYGNKGNSYGRDQVRQVGIPVGLFNVSNCCYLNSLLQCYFLMGSFVREILSAEQIKQLPIQSGNKNKRITNLYLLLETLKQIFAKMKLSSRRYLDPTPVLKNLVNSVGEKIQYGDQKDLHQINMEIVERLSQCLMYTKKYYIKDQSNGLKVNRKENIKNLFYGEKVEIIDGLEGQNISDFMGVILNPKYDNIIFALDAQFHYDVQITGKIMKKHAYIRSLPKYLFLTISRIQKKGSVLCKNVQKISFDFVLYMDQYLQKNKQESKQKYPKIRQLQNRITIIKSQLNHLNILAQKLQQCRLHTKYLKDWDNKLPKQSQLQQQKSSYLKQIQQIQQQLSTIQSRNQKFILLYIFVHRGDAISGHYWGYGRNGNQWYKFDVNCTRIKQGDILVDIQKCSGTAYALVYAKSDQIQCFSYPYNINNKIQMQQFFKSTFHSNNSNISDSHINKNQKKDYIQYIPNNLKKQIIQQNIAMHESIQKQKNKTIVQNIIKDYKIKYNLIKSQYQKYQKDQPNNKIPLYTNFACFLQSIKQNQFMKYNIYSVVLFSKAQITYKELLQNQILLKNIQKSFKNKIKGKMQLKSFALQYQPKQGTKYKQYIDQYLLGKKCLQFIKIIYTSIKNWPKIDNLYSLLQQITEVLRINKQGVYIKSMTRQIIAIMLIDLVKKGIPIRLEWVNACDKKNSLLKDQLIALSAKQINGIIQLKQNITKIQLERDWNVMNLKKGFQYQYMKAIKEIIQRLNQGFIIYKMNTRENKLYIQQKIVEKVQNVELI